VCVCVCVCVSVSVSVCERERERERESEWTEGENGLQKKRIRRRVLLVQEK